MAVLRRPSPQTGSVQSLSHMSVFTPPLSQSSGPFCTSSPQYCTAPESSSQLVLQTVHSVSP